MCIRSRRNKANIIEEMNLLRKSLVIIDNVKINCMCVCDEKEREINNPSSGPAATQLQFPKETQKNKTLMEILEKEMESKVAVKASCCT